MARDVAYGVVAVPPCASGFEAEFTVSFDATGTTALLSWYSSISCIDQPAERAHPLAVKPGEYAVSVQPVLVRVTRRRKYR